MSEYEQGKGERQEEGTDPVHMVIRSVKDRVGVVTWIMTSPSVVAERQTGSVQIRSLKPVSR